MIKAELLTLNSQKHDQYMINLRKLKFLRKIVYTYRNILEKRSYVHGKGNMIENHAVLVNSKIQVSGNNNRILLEDGVTLVNARIFIQGSNCHVRIRGGAHLRGTDLYCQDDNLNVIIGSNTYISSSNLSVTEGRALRIGNDCMLAGNIQIRTGDSHSILDEEGYRINHAMDVVISDHVWIGEGAKILKGVSIAENCIVATGAVLTKKTEPNQLWGGVPARLIKEHVTWEKSRKL